MISQSQNWYSKANQKGRLQGTLASVEDALCVGPFNKPVPLHLLCHTVPAQCVPAHSVSTAYKEAGPTPQRKPQVTGKQLPGPPPSGERGGMEKNISPKCHDSVARSLCRSPALWLPPSPGHAEVPPLFLCSQMTQTGHLGKT